MRSTSVLLVGLTACGTSVSSTPLNPAPRAMRARDPDAVEVYSSAPPARPHVDVALLEATQTEGLNEQSTSLMVRRLREQAASMGCDALLLGGMSQRSGAPLGSDFSALDPGSRTLPATCIVYVEPGAGAVAGDAESDASARSEK